MPCSEKALSIADILRDHVGETDALEGVPQHAAGQRGKQQADGDADEFLEAVATGVGHRGKGDGPRTADRSSRVNCE